MSIKEEEIRPEDIFNEYLRLTQIDVISYFSKVKKEDINCPSCENKGILLFEKQGFKYESCTKCKTIFVNPRPIKEAFDNYYSDSPSTKFWATTFYKNTENARRLKLWKPKAKLIYEKIQKFAKDSSINTIVDIGGGYGVFDEEIKKISAMECIIIEPSVHLSQICRKKGFRTIEKFFEDITSDELPNMPTCFVSFELFEHLHSPKHFLTVVADKMKSGDLFIFTTLSGMGIDIQLLGAHSRALSPPHHLNFLNPKSVSHLIEKVGLKVIEATTPGKLDMDIIKKNKDYIKDSFWKNILEYASTQELDKMQIAISELKLSSHMMVVCQK